MSFWSSRRKPPAEFATIHDAAEAGDFAAVQAFVRGGTNPNVQSHAGATALHIASARGYVDVAKFLVENGSEIDFLVEEGGTPLMAAVAGLRPAVVEFLLSKGTQPNKRGHDGRFPLVCAFQPAVIAISDQVKSIRLLVEYGADVNACTDSGITPLMNAAWFGNREAAEELLRLGADATLKSASGKTAATLAFERGHDSLAQLLARP